MQRNGREVHKQPCVALRNQAPDLDGCINSLNSRALRRLSFLFRNAQKSFPFRRDWPSFHGSTSHGSVETLLESNVSTCILP